VLLAGGPVFSLAVALPQLFGRGKPVERDFAGDSAIGGGTVVLQEGVTIGAVGEGHIQYFGVLEGLLHAIADRVVVILGLDDGQRDVGFVEEQIVRLLRLPPLHGLAADDDAAFGEISLLADLGHHVPLAAVYSDQRGRYILGADVCF